MIFRDGGNFTQHEELNMSINLWIEVDIRLKDRARMNEVLLTLVDGFVQNHMKKLMLWHF